MDKQTLSNYGWIIVVVLILAVMISLATPFGKYTSDSFQATYEGLTNANKLVVEPYESIPSVHYYQVYKGEYSWGPVEFVFHSDGAVDIWGEDIYCEWGNAREPGSAVYQDGKIEFDNTIFQINQDGTISTDSYWGEPLTLTLDPVNINPVKLNQTYVYYGDNNSVFSLEFRANGSAIYKQWMEETGHIVHEFAEGEFQYYDKYMVLDGYENGIKVNKRIGVHPSGEKIVLNENTYNLVIE